VLHTADIDLLIVELQRIRPYVGKGQVIYLTDAKGIPFRILRVVEKALSDSSRVIDVQLI
jgi:hypothetical protein